LADLAMVVSEIMAPPSVRGGWPLPPCAYPLPAERALVPELEVRGIALGPGEVAHRDGRNLVFARVTVYP